MTGLGGAKPRLDSTNVWKEHGLTEEEYARIETLMQREPNYLELSLFGVMWSEHCSYKNSRAQLRKFPVTGPQVVQGPGENAGVVRLDAERKLCAAFKMESHNHPSAIEPYQGAATGVGGIIRDIFAMGARPVASLNSLRFGSLDDARAKGLFRGVVAGVGGYGNCIGIPTVGGETFFHPSYHGNPLVNAMCVGLVEEDKIFKGQATGVGNIVMLVGARTGRDGIKGASFASEELSDSDPDKRPNVQVGDPFMEKLLLEASLEVLEAGLVVGLQDLGAAGLTSSGSEMAGRAGSGLYIDLDKVPLREKAMEAWEIMLSESQERMLMIVEPSKVEEIQKVFDKWDLIAAAVGEVTGDGCFTVRKGEVVLASVPAEFLTDKAPVNIRPAAEPEYFRVLKKADCSELRGYGNWTDLLKKLLSSPNIASKRWVYEQYDSTIGTNTVVRPGSDAAVLRLPGSGKGMALATDCNSRYAYLDPWRGGAIAVAEAARNVAASGAKPLAITNCLNFGNPEKPEIYWQFVQATDGMAEACKAFSTPVTGGNVSFYNEYDGRAIYPAPTIGMVGVLENVEDRVTSDFKAEGDLVVLVGETLEELGASEAHFLLTGKDEGEVPVLDFEKEKRLHAFLVEAAETRLLASAHDCSDGGLAVAVAECAITGSDATRSAFKGDLGAALDWAGDVSPAAMLFGESQSRAVISVSPDKWQATEALLKKLSLAYTPLGKVGGAAFSLRYNGAVLVDCPLEDLAGLWSDSVSEIMR
ncbi:MAG: phosphoribosylformylglycinamidine synthase subunit PurL [Synergistaceae bacterium]|jgi:phosphoribosylformylglycinamidine synthase|nr:phosphoribosylformylglycinamidine synthase subunit PurL [Synergistaceae bacterium]